MKTLQRMLSRTFLAPAARKPDPHRKAREEAKRLAEKHGIEIERCSPGWNVWPPKDSSVDPWEGDHYCGDWAAVLFMVQDYAGVARWDQ